MFEGAASVLSPRVSKKIMDIYIESIKRDKEFSMLVCNDDVLPLRSLSNERMTKVEIGEKDIRRLCSGDDSVIYIHTHGNFLPSPSIMDHRANEKIFSFPNVGYSCIAGTSGVYCIDRLQREVLYPWGSNYYRSVDEDEKVNIVRGDSLFCDKRGNRYECEINKEGFSRRIGVFDNISLEGTAMLGESGTDVMSQVHSPNEMLECTIMKDENRNHATLNCFKRNNAEVEHARSSGNFCGFIDRCHPKI